MSERASDLAGRLTQMRDALGITQLRAAVDAMVATETFRRGENGESLKPASRHRLEAWLARAERRLAVRNQRGKT